VRGASLKAVRELLGHESIEMTLRYSHLTPDVKREAVQLLDWAETGRPSTGSGRAEGAARSQKLGDIRETAEAQKENPRGHRGFDEREKGFESGLSIGFSSLFLDRKSDRECVTGPDDASGRVATSTEASDVPCTSPSLPEVSPELFFAAGALAAANAARAEGTRSRVEEILRRAVDQAAAVRGEAP
jgi:hypothetical protein